MALILIGLPFFRGVAQGWVTYYESSTGPTFTEKQIRMADNVAATLDGCHPVTDFLDSSTHMEVCRNLRNEEYIKASRELELSSPLLDLSKAGCIEALKIGVWLIGTCAPESIRSATFNILACDYYFRTI